ncbi:ribosome maturation factor RimM [Clostridiisalibacter paucivorans]|uniref:ribosome maturation factor RimM n=1 Tax=Clostridiisalibacter paucivorans TaxID=408753 RepID=UPI000479F067|nr:ribosome maturation factor RimM [Clostridiisalibacter paucivorans]
MEYIQVGKIVNTQGIKGELKIIPLTNEKERFEDFDRVFVGEDKEELSIDGIWYKKGFVIIKFDQYNNINDVLKYKEQFIYIDKKNAIKLPEDNYFIFDIVGLEVFDMENKYLGEVVDVLQNGGADIYVIKKEDKQYMVPAVKEFIKDINIERKCMIISPIEGLIE